MNYWNKYGFIKLNQVTKPFFNLHSSRQTDKNVCIISTPRSGSTWLFEIVASQNGFKAIDEPFNIRKQEIRKYLGINEWYRFYEEGSDQKILNYFSSFFSGKGVKAHFKDRSPLYKHYRYKTDKIVFKILHGLENNIVDIQKHFGLKVIFLIRHPIPVALSREVLPRLEPFIFSEYSANFSAQQIKLAKKIFEKGSFLEKAVIDWCFQNYLLIKSMHKSNSLITYEQIVTEPDKVIDFLSTRFHLSEKDKMLQSINSPSMSTRKSNSETQNLLKEKDNRISLIHKWKKKVSPEETTDLMNIVKKFGIDIYSENVTAKQEYWI